MYVDKLYRTYTDVLTRAKSQKPYRYVEYGTIYVLEWDRGNFSAIYAWHAVFHSPGVV
jgi:hypothetical protein